MGFFVVHAQTQSTTGLLDLRIYLGAARSMADGGSIYAFSDPTFHLGSTYPPLWSLMLGPIAHADIHTVEYGWTMANLLVWLATLLAVARPTGRDPVTRVVTRNEVLLVWLVTIPSAPVWNTLNQGQLNLVLWFLLIGDLRAVARSSRAAGVGAGIGAALKLVPGIALVMYLMARRWRAALVGAASFVGVSGLATLLTRDDSQLYWTHLVFDTTRVGSIGGDQNNSIRALLQRIGISGTPEIVLWVVATIVLLVVATPSFRASLNQRSTITSAVLIGCVMSLVSPISWTHHLVFLGFLPLLVLPGRTGRRPDRSLLGLAAIAIVLVDPLGFGRLGATSSLRTLAMIGLVAGAPWLLRLECRWRGTDADSEPPRPAAGPNERRKRRTRHRASALLG